MPPQVSIITSFDAPGYIGGHEMILRRVYEVAWDAAVEGYQARLLDYEVVGEANGGN